MIFPAGYHHDYGRQEPLLAVYSLRGLALPDDASGLSEDIDERLSMCVLYLAAWLAQRAMYIGDIHARKGIFLDEAWALSTFGSGRRFIDRAPRDSRKHKARVLLASQNPSDLIKLELANLVSAALIGRLTDQEAQKDALRCLPGVPDGEGYEQIFGTLSRPSREGRRGAREFVFSDGSGGIERIRMELWQRAGGLQRRRGQQPPRQRHPTGRGGKHGFAGSGSDAPHPTLAWRGPAKAAAARAGRPPAGR